MASNAKNLAELLNQDSTVAAGDVADGSITTAKLADDAVTSAKLGASAVDATALASNAVTTAKVADSAVTTVKTSGLNLGRRNLAINGGMQVAQRNTSQTGISSGGSYHTLDRWRLAIDTSGTWTQSQEALAVTDPPFVQHGHKTALKMDCTTANGSLSAGSYIQLQYRIEGFDLQRLRTGSSSPAPMTISFWIKATKTGTNVVNVFQDEGGKQVAFPYTISASNTWEHKTITIPGNTHDAINNDNTRGRQITWYLSAGSNRTSGSLQSTWQNYATGDEAVGQVNHSDSTSNNFHITGVQIEQGSLATDFEFRPFGEELIMCKRYYEKSFPYATAPSNSGSGTDFSTYQGIRWVFQSNNNSYQSHHRWDVEKRTTPSVTPYGNSSGYWYSPSTNWHNHNDIAHFSSIGFLPRQQASGGVIEVYGHYGVDAEV